MRISKKDKAILQRLAEETAAIADLPVHQQKAAEWTCLNDRQTGRPLVWINELPWHEMDLDGELTLQTTGGFCRQVEQRLRQTLYEWRHLPADMIVEKTFYSPLAIHSTGFGISEDVDIIRLDKNSDICSREFHSQIHSEKDLDKIKTPVVTHDAVASEAYFQALNDAFGDILPVEKCGIVHTWFAPWDELIRWWDVEEAMVDLVARPELVHAAMDRLVNAYLAELKQWEELNLLSRTAGNYRVGSGGPGYTTGLSRPDFNPQRIRPCDQWGCGTAQIFADVSPEMHEEFALRYERRWMERFGLVYYGCCEPLHLKLDLLKSIPNLRKISMSPWADVDKYVAKAGDRYVLSHKPNPAVLAMDRWNPDLARKNLAEVLEKTRGCVVEVIMKDVSTVRYEPQRLWEWSRIAMELTEKYAP